MGGTSPGDEDVIRMGDSEFRKSSRSMNNGNCTEVGTTGGAVMVRDSKDNEAGPVLWFTPGAWQVFTRILEDSHGVG